jgi:hypothetical protein
MPLTKRSFFFVCLLIYSSLQSFGQAAKSPFSAFGIGDHFGNELAHNQGMGGVGISNPQYWYLNNQNPSLLIFNRFTVFSAGFVADQRSVADGQNSEVNSDGNLNYLTLGFPVKSTKWGMAVGLTPYSNSNYELNYTAPIEGSANTVLITESGSGGINQLYWSNGVALNKTLSVGAKVSYLFSSIINEFSNELSQTNQPLPFTSTIHERLYFSDFSLTTGASFHKDSLFNKDYRFNVGVVYDLQADIRTKYFQRIERRTPVGVTDSVTLINNVPGTTTLPPSLGVGISFGKGVTWTVAADYIYYDYTKFKNFNGDNPASQKGSQMALGFELTPNPGSLDNYLKRATYRTGVSYSTSPYLVNGNSVNDFGINFGLSLPVSRVSSLDLALKFGKRGDLQTNTIEESYIKFYFGVTFNDQWFIKRKFD